MTFRNSSLRHRSNAQRFRECLDKKNAQLAGCNMSCPQSRRGGSVGRRRRPHPTNPKGIESLSPGLSRVSARAYPGINGDKTPNSERNLCKKNWRGMRGLAEMVDAERSRRSDHIL